MIEDDATFATLRPKSGDVVVVKVKTILSAEYACHLRDTLAGRMPDGVQVWILDESSEITLIEAP